MGGAPSCGFALYLWNRRQGAGSLPELKTRADRCPVPSRGPENRLSPSSFSFGLDARPTAPSHPQRGVVNVRSREQTHVGMLPMGFARFMSSFPVGVSWQPHRDVTRTSNAFSISWKASSTRTPSIEGAFLRASGSGHHVALRSWRSFGALGRHGDGRMAAQ